MYDVGIEASAGTTVLPERDHVDASTISSLHDDVAGHLNAQHGRLLDLTVWLLANPVAWQGDGVRTVAQYLGWRCGIGPSTARNLVVAAERAGELPVSIDAVRRGELSLDQLMPIVRKVPAWANAEMASLAKRLTVSQISRTVNRMNWQSNPCVRQHHNPTRYRYRYRHCHRYRRGRGRRSRRDTRVRSTEHFTPG
jgi:Domain of unknown function (DUF222)